MTEPDIYTVVVEATVAGTAQVRAASLEEAWEKASSIAGLDELSGIKFDMEDPAFAEVVDVYKAEDAS